MSLTEIKPIWKESSTRFNKLSLSNSYRSMIIISYLPVIFTCTSIRWIKDEEIALQYELLLHIVLTPR
jgi:hypothetical protein